MAKKNALHPYMKELLARAIKAEIEAEKKKRTYRKQQTTPIPEGIEAVQFAKPSESVSKRSIVLQEAPPLNLEQLYCSHSQYTPLFYIEKAEALQMKRVHNVRVKERLIAARKMRQGSQELQKWMHKKVERFPVEGEGFSSLLSHREERHYQIDRTIRYLSDA